MQTETQTLTQLARSMRPPAITDQPAPLPTPPAPFDTPVPVPVPEIAPAPPAATSSATSTVTDSDAASFMSDDNAQLRRRFRESPAPRQSLPPPQPNPAAPIEQEWSLGKWLPLLVAAATFMCIFSAGPLVVQGKFRKADGLPDKAQWAAIAGGGAALAMLAVYAVRQFS